MRRLQGDRHPEKTGRIPAPTRRGQAGNHASRLTVSKPTNTPFVPMRSGRGSVALHPLSPHEAPYASRGPNEVHATRSLSRQARRVDTRATARPAKHQVQSSRERVRHRDLGTRCSNRKSRCFPTSSRPNTDKPCHLPPGMKTRRRTGAIGRTVASRWHSSHGILSASISIVWSLGW
jgi:hypothetical protein